MEENTMNTDNTMESRTGKKTIIIFALLSLIVIIPILIYAAHSFPVADDFNVENDLNEVLPVYHSYFISALVWVYRYYVQIGGYYSDVFLSYLLSPLTRWGLPGLRAVNTLIYVVFFLSAFFMIRSFVREILRLKDDTTWILFFIFILSLFNNYNNHEIYTWYDVVSEYVFISSIAMIGYGLLFISISRRNRLYIPAAICAFTVSGGVLNMVIANCGILFLFGVYMYMFCNRRKEVLTVFISSLVGAVINLVSPGNFIRHDGMSQGYDLVGAVKHTVMYAGYLLEDKISHSLFILIAIVVFIILYNRVDVSALPYADEADPKRYAHPVLLLCLMGLGVFLINFPVHLGYNDPNLSGRAVFIQDLAIYYMMFMWMLYFIGWLKSNNYDIRFTPESYVILTIVCVLTTITTIGANGGIRSYTTGNMLVSVANGDLDEYVRYEEAILEEIKNSPDSDVVLHRDQELSIPYVKPNWLKEDTGFFINAWTAEYYGKNSVKMIYSVSSSQ